jgi:hypothetical protein
LNLTQTAIGGIGGAAGFNDFATSGGGGDATSTLIGTNTSQSSNYNLSAIATGGIGGVGGFEGGGGDQLPLKLALQRSMAVLRAQMLLQLAVQCRIPCRNMAEMAERQVR